MLWLQNCWHTSRNLTAIRLQAASSSPTMVFMAGGDIAEMAARNARIGNHEHIERQKVYIYIKNMDKPVIAAVNDFALDGGCELYLAGDFRITSTAAKFWQLKLNVGIIPFLTMAPYPCPRIFLLLGRGLQCGEIYDSFPTFASGATIFTSLQFGAKVRTVGSTLGFFNVQ